MTTIGVKVRGLIWANLACISFSLSGIAEARLTCSVGSSLILKRHPVFPQCSVMNLPGGVVVLGECGPVHVATEISPVRIL